MMKNIALLGPKNSLMEDAGRKIKSLQNRSDILHISYFQEVESLVEVILNFDIVAVSDEIFKIVLPRVQEALLEQSKATSRQKKIVLTNLKTPLDASAIQKWWNELGLSDEVLAIPIRNGMTHEKIRDIVYFEYSNRKVFVKTSNDYYETKLKMKEVRAKVGNYFFETPYVSFVVHLHWVETIESKDIVMKNGDRIPLSQKKAHTFRKAYKQFLSYMH